MSLRVNLPEELAARVAEAAAERGVSAEEVVTDAVAAQLRAPIPDDTGVLLAAADTDDADPASCTIRT